MFSRPTSALLWLGRHDCYVGRGYGLAAAYGDQSSLHLGSKRAKIRCMRAALIRSSTML